MRKKVKSLSVCTWSNLKRGPTNLTLGLREEGISEAIHPSESHSQAVFLLR